MRCGICAMKLSQFNELRVVTRTFSQAVDHLSPQVKALELGFTWESETVGLEGVG